MSILRRMFGPNRNEVWQALAKEIGARFEERGSWKGGSRVTAEVGEWTVTLDCYTVQTAEVYITYTRLRAPFVNPDGFRFSVRPQGFMDGLGRMLGLQYVEIGHPEFDRAFVVKSKDEHQVRRLLELRRLRELLMADPRVCLSVKDDEGWFGAKFPDGVDELCFTVVGEEKDIAKLKAFYDLFAETLHSLCHIGSAYEQDPGIAL